MPKINFIVYFFLEILYIKESSSSIGQQDLGSKLENNNFARYEIGGEVSITLFHFRLFSGKLMTKFLQKIQAILF